MYIVAVVVWCWVGTTSLIWLSWDREAFTWGNLVFCLVLGGCIGPILWVIIGLKILVQADFWNKPIFGKSK